jgi:AraC-like DNA-binding protein
MVLEAAERGLPIDALLARLGLDQDSLRMPERRVAFADLFPVWADCMRAIRDPGLPLAAAQRLRLEDYAVVGFATTSASTFRAAVSLLARYGTLLADGCRWEVEDEPTRPSVKLLWQREGERTLGHRVANECAVAEALHASRQILGFALVPVAVAFRHSAPSSLKAHEAFFGLTPRFGARWEGLAFSRDLFDRVPRQANPPLAQWLERQMAATLATRVAPTTFAERVEEILERDLASGEPDLARIARLLGLSERTVRRQLAREERSFRGLWESVRRRRAEALLSAGSVTIDEVAFLTGFAETSAFARAFKRWTGETPGAFRRTVHTTGDRIGQETGHVEQ